MKLPYISDLLARSRTCPDCKGEGGKRRLTDRSDSEDGYRWVRCIRCRGWGRIK